LLVHTVGLSTAEALRAATVTGARAAGQQSATGTLEAGKLANFVVLTANPLQQIENVRRVEMVIKHGNRYLRRDYHPISAAPENDLQ
jgi:imidazolonepropionase-like amidohydrolase